MTQITIHPIDPKAKGSHRERQKLVALLAAQVEALQSKNAVGVVQAQNAINEFAVAHMTTDDGTDIERAIDDISQDEFERLVDEFTQARPSIPPANADNSPKP